MNETEKGRAPDSIAGHPLQFESAGLLKPWTRWRVALQREMAFYQSCPLDHGYPRFVCETFLDADWNPSDARSDIIPATQNGLGILSYLKYYEFTGRGEPAYLKTATLMGDYLLRESLTPDGGVFPRFTRSTGRRQQFPQPADAGSQSDRPFEIEPDKGGIAGYALGLLSQVSGDPEYLNQALHQARILSKYQTSGDARRSPFPFRVDYRDGTPRGPISGNMSFILRLYDLLLAEGYDEFVAARGQLWRWIEDHQIPSAEGNGALFAQFFEDHDTPTNRSAWAPLNLARYLLEMRGKSSPRWLAYVDSLVEFTRDNFTHAEFGVRVCHEQDEDHQAWGGINSTYGAVLAQWARATGSENMAKEARAALNYTLYLIDDLGRPRDVFTNQSPGGWQEDAHTDVIHNFVDAMRTFPDWADS